MGQDQESWRVNPSSILQPLQHRRKEYFNGNAWLPWSATSVPVQTHYEVIPRRAPRKVIKIPESRKYLLVKSGIQKIFARGIRNPENICSWNPESRKHLLIESRIQEILAYGIRNPSLCNPPTILESRFYWGSILNPVPGIRNPHHGIWNPVPGIQDCHGLLYAWGEISNINNNNNSNNNNINININRVEPQSRSWVLSFAFDR